MDNPYIRLTQEFNHGRLRAILASGQAVVLYRQAITHVIAALARHGARYRYGAPLDLRWLVCGMDARVEGDLGPAADRGP